MQTTKNPQVLSSENSVNCRLEHRSFLTQAGKSKRVKSKRFTRKIDKSQKQILSLLGMEDFTLRSPVVVHPEFVAYTFHLYGLSRILLTYVVFFELDNKSCRFSLDASLRQRFREFCGVFGEEAECDEKAILQSARVLIRKNCMLRISEEEYMLNPLIAGGTIELRRRKLINEYCDYLDKKGFSASADFYPRYQVPRNGQH